MKSKKTSQSPNLEIPLALLLFISFSTPSQAAKKSKSGSGRERSIEWKELPTQSWELGSLQLPPEVDKDGIDSRSKIRFHQESGIFPLYFIAPDDYKPLGTVTGARSSAEYLTLGDVIVFEPETEERFQVGTLVSIAKPALEISGKKSARDGEVYPLLGTAKIRGFDTEEGESAEPPKRYYAEIVAARAPIPRKSKIITHVSRLKIPTLRPGPQPLQAFGTLPPPTVETQFAQGQFIFIDRGTEDGIEGGMIFRAYQTKDPNTRETIAESSQLIAADVLVIQVGQNYSMGLVQKGRTELPDSTPLVLLTDISDVSWKKEYSAPTIPPTAGDQALDSLDATPAEAPKPTSETEDDPALNDDEQRELKQLETHEVNAPPPAEIKEAEKPAGGDPKLDPDLD